VYSDTPPTAPDEGHSVERRWVLDFSYNWKLDEGHQADKPRPHGSTRHRPELPHIEFADRLKLEHETKLGRQTVTPYGQLEAYYDSRYDTVSRYRLEIGTTTPLSKDIEVDLYVGPAARQPNPAISTPTARG